MWTSAWLSHFQLIIESALSPRSHFALTLAKCQTKTPKTKQWQQQINLYFLFPPYREIWKQICLCGGKKKNKKREKSKENFPPFSSQGPLKSKLTSLLHHGTGSLPQREVITRRSECRLMRMLWWCAYRKRSIAETISAVVINWLCEKPAGDGVREGRGEGGRKWEEEVGGWYGGVANVRSCADMNLLSLVWSGDWWENLWGIWEPDSRARWELEVVSLLHCPPPLPPFSRLSHLIFLCFLLVSFLTLPTFILISFLS